MSREPPQVAGPAGYGEWIHPDVGDRVRQLVPHGPFVVQRREDLGGGACRLTRHRTADATTFVVEGYSLRSEIGLPCHVVHLRDEADGASYVVDTGLCGPGLPAEAFTASSASPSPPTSS
ncbi:MAG TPA: hypothetical protein VFG74_02795 [Miltoncostaeaceae bacterium]|jgi:hypothetical protein|nr:hypothetical protein [Miltoncostaeaceae bacterium]